MLEAVAVVSYSPPRLARAYLVCAMAIDQFGKYLLLRRLALGGMAEIFLAKQTGVQGFEKLVVVKRILANLATEKEFVQMFLDEARLAATLTHPNIVQIYDLGETNGSFYIAMEF